MKHIQDIIDTAMQRQESHAHMRQILSSKLDQVARLVSTPEDDHRALETLYDFTMRYVEQTPRMLSNLTDAAFDVGVSKQVAPVVLKAEAFFTSPTLALLAPKNLYNLLQESYLAQRLIEEVNDITLFKFGQALVPFDMTMSNLIVHTIIGEEHACELDIIVDDAVTHLSQLESSVLSNQVSASNLVKIFQRIPSLHLEMGLQSSLV